MTNDTQVPQALSFADRAAARRRRAVYLSGTRADFGLMVSTLTLLNERFDLSIAVTGMHLDPAYGNTVDAIRASGLRICGLLPVDVQTRSSESMAVALGQTLSGLAPLLAREQPDLLLLLGDRGETLAGAIAALHLGVACVHIHGGERSGTVDEPMRHAISKLAHYHAVATEASRQRLIRMGEAPERICVTGAPGLDGLMDLAALSATDCRAALGMGEADFALVLFHPVVQQAGQAFEQTAALLQALHQRALPVVWMEPNADAGSLEVLRALDQIGLPPGSVRRRHLERAVFASVLRHCALLLGNSSAGIIEAASFGTPVVNVGSRQNLRERNANVIDCEPTTDALAHALQTALTQGRGLAQNVYGDGQAGPRIANWLAEIPLDAKVLEKVNAY